MIWSYIHFTFIQPSGEDAVEDTNEENPFASLLPENESLYIDDPKKALKGFYEREGVVHGFYIIFILAVSPKDSYQPTSLLMLHFFHLFTIGKVAMI